MHVRFKIFLALLFTIAIGLASRKLPWLFPEVFGKYPGDALWAIAANVKTVSLAILYGLIAEYFFDLIYIRHSS
jgi:hypothetical protein